jgi:DNA-binding MarR family transcriptional regulator
MRSSKTPNRSHAFSPILESRPTRHDVHPVGSRLFSVARGPSSLDQVGTASYWFSMVDSSVSLAFSRADAAFSAALRSALGRARLRGVVDPGMGPVMFDLEERGASSMSALAEAARVPRSTMTGIVARLEKRGIVRTAPNPEDGRGIVVALTPKGRLLVPRLRRIAGDLDDTIGAALSEGEVKQLAGLLNRLALGFDTG